MKKFKKIIIGVIIVLTAYTVTGFFILPVISRYVLVKKLSVRLNREVFIKQLRMNPYDFSVTIKDFIIKEQGSQKPFLSFEELYLNIKGSSVIKRVFVINELKLDNPFVNIIRHKDRIYKYNFSGFDKFSRIHIRQCSESAENSKTVFEINEAAKKRNISGNNGNSHR